MKKRWWIYKFLGIKLFYRRMELLWIVNLEMYRFVDVCKFKLFFNYDKIFFRFLF